MCPNWKWIGPETKIWEGAISATSLANFVSLCTANRLFALRKLRERQHGFFAVEFLIWNFLGKTPNFPSLAVIIRHLECQEFSGKKPISIFLIHKCRSCRTAK